MLENHPRNPLVVLIFTFFGASIRYLFFSAIGFIRGEKYPKRFDQYSEGFNQVLYNILLLFLLLIGGLIWIAYQDLKSKGLA
jgi:membrane protein DedA with SNARE-associated domain